MGNMEIKEGKKNHSFWGGGGMRNLLTIFSEAKGKKFNKQEGPIQPISEGGRNLGRAERCESCPTNRGVNYSHHVKKRKKEV